MNTENTTPMRAGEELPQEPLHSFLLAHLDGYREILELRQFPGGYSNLTYSIRTNIGYFVLRRPPLGANIKSAHDMGREYKVLRMLQPVYPRIPAPVLYCDDAGVIGAPFYLMEKVEGLVLRNRPPEGLYLGPEVMHRLSCAAIDNLADLHALDIDHSGLRQLGKPEGYVQRQVEGWSKRYEQSATDTIPGMAFMAEWMHAQLPTENPPALLHNDYKYDNLVLNPDKPDDIRAVLDWEMCTVGDPLMDLGLSLAYWLHEGEGGPLLSSIGTLTWLPGNLTRGEAAARYADRSGRNIEQLLFYYVFGNFKIGVIVQQIYFRYKKGFTQDPRFSRLIDAVRFFGERGQKAIEAGRI